ncbi:MAG: DUF1440 domain-containing protein [Chloroflexia bacterium]|nr:DUF1440 domain-containing protein [Chloroflexia bacterium]
MTRNITDLKRLLSPPARPGGLRWERGARSDNLDHLTRGALAGIVATGFMTPVIAVGRALNLLWTPPPAQITENLAKRAGVNPDEDHVAFQLVWLAAHGGYGVVCGATYVAMRPILPRATVVAGLLYGGGVWTASYIALMPALNLYPSPEEDSRSRLAVMVVAHAVFGVSLAEVERRLAHRS